MVTPDTEVVQGYIYSNSFDEERSGTVCRILARSAPDPGLDLMPEFVVEFGNGEVIEVLGECLSPWFPT